LLIKEHILGVDTNGTEEYTTEYEYNSQDLLIKAHSTRAQSDGDFIESTTEYEYNDQGSPISVYTLISECTPYYVVEEEEQYNYTYDETGKCIMVEFVHSFNGREYPRVQFQCDNSGYIYDNGGEQLYPISLPSVYYPELPRILYSYG
jgi:YD repeat-containing protein